MKTKRIVQFGATSRLSRQRGASLLEGIAYLGIAAIVVLGAVSLLGGAFSSAQSNQTMEELISLRTGVRKLYAGQNYGAANTNLLPQMVPANIIPGTLARTGNTVKNAWGGDVTVVGNVGTFSITYNDIPQDVCINTITGANGWTDINGETDFPVTAADATTICNADSNDVTFTAS